MLAAPLLRVTVRKGMIMPLFCTRSDELDLAQRMVKEFQESYRVHERKSELYNRISIIESSHNDYKLVRGFCALLERRCAFNVHSYTNSSITNNPAKTTTSQSTNATAIIIDPIDVRRMLFEESSKKGFALTDLERNSIVNSIAEKLQISSEDIGRVMWSDLDENMVFEYFEYIHPKTLVGWYNLSLMQTLLFNATKMEFHISGGANWKRILRNVKRLGLMYYLESRRQQQDKGDENNKIIGNSSLVCTLEGPLSLFKLTDRYGTSLAKLLPSIVLTKEDVDWQIDAWVLRKTMMQGKKLYQFKISNREAPQFLADPFYANKYKGNTENGKVVSTVASAPFTSLPEYSFDSLVEEKFARKFNEVIAETSGWKLVREPDPLIVANARAFIPDFMFEKYDNRVYLEIVGFWTPEYLERKLQKVKHILKANDLGSNSNGHNKTRGTAVVDLFIAINEELAGSKVSSTSSSSSETFSSSVPLDKLIFYKNDSVPIRPILDYLKALDKEMIDKKTRDPNLRIEVDRSKDIISVEDLARKYNNLPIEIIPRIVSRDYGDLYISIGTGSQQQHHHYLISKTKAKQMETLIKKVKLFSDACLIFSENAIPEAFHAELVEKLGYKVIWQSMDISTAVIEKKKDTST